MFNMRPGFHSILVKKISSMESQPSYSSAISISWWNPQPSRTFILPGGRNLVERWRERKLKVEIVL